jgi:hypothetical protein
MTPDQTDATLGRDGVSAPATTGRRRRGWGWWAVLTLIVLLAAATSILWRRPALVIAVGVAVVLAWPMAAFFRFARRHPVIAAGVILVVLLSSGGALVILLALPGAPHGVVPQVSLTVHYHADGQVQAKSVILQEQLVLDRDAVQAMARTLRLTEEQITQLLAGSAVSVDGWQPGGQVDGYPSFTRARTVAAGATSLVASTVTIPVQLGHLSVAATGRSVPISVLPRTGSDVQLTAARGAIGETFPAVAGLAGGVIAGHEVSTISVDPYVDEVSLAVLAGPLRNPAGKTVYQAFTWGPLPWVVGTVLLLAASALGDMVKQSAIRVIGGAFRRRRQPAALAGAAHAADPVPPTPGDTAG